MSQLIKQIINQAKRAMSLELEYKEMSHKEPDEDKRYFSIINEVRCSGKVDAYGEVLELLGIDRNEYEDIKDKHGYYDDFKKIFIQNAIDFDDIESVKGLLESQLPLSDSRIKPDDFVLR